MKVPDNLDQFGTLAAIMAKLRAADGCPWDRQQTHRSLRGSLLGECYEVLEALDAGDSGKLRDELGDLLLQIVFHAQIAAESSDFTMADVIRGINGKLVHRHPHIFGTQKVRDAAEVAHNWDVLKQEEREAGTSILAGVSRQMPALAYSQEIQRRVVRAGFDWKDVDGVIDKVVEEVGELKEASSQARRAEEFGDLLFTLVSVARWLDIDSEAALREASQRFHRRFTHMEELCRQRGLKFAELSFEQQNGLWEEAKKAV